MSKNDSFVRFVIKQAGKLRKSNFTTRAKKCPKFGHNAPKIR